MKHVMSFTADGTPAPQGSKTAIPAKTKAGVYTGKVSLVESSKALKPWREVVAAAARAAKGSWLVTVPEGPVILTIEFRFQRPKGHYGTGRNAGKLKDWAPAYHLTKPDIDKLERGILDALTMAGVYKDDSQAVSVTAWKAYADNGAPGVTVHVATPLD